MEPEPIRIPIKDVFDLHTVPPRDVKEVVEEYLSVTLIQPAPTVQS
jgi:hypothetical protein